MSVNIESSEELADSFEDENRGEPAPVVEPAVWEKTLERVIPGIVSIKFVSVRCFDTESAMFSQATGFLVDKARGIILTNRHVVNPVTSPCFTAL